MLCADGEVVWSWHTKAGVKLATMLCIAPMTVAKKPGHRGEREGNRKTIAQGRPGLPGRTCGDFAGVLLFNRTPGCGCSQHPAFPAPSFRGDVIAATTRAHDACRERVL